MNTFIRALACSVALPAISLAGCVGALVVAGLGVGAGVGAVFYAEGKLVSTEKVSMDAAWDAVQKTAKDLELNVLESSKDELSATMRARQADGTEINIYLDRASEDLVQITIRVGVFGDEPTSRLILDKIRGHLGLPPSVPTAEAQNP